MLLVAVAMKWGRRHQPDPERCKLEYVFLHKVGVVLIEQDTKNPGS